jgi:hypothetical protein
VSGPALLVWYFGDYHRPADEGASERERARACDRERKRERESAREGERENLHVSSRWLYERDEEDKQGGRTHAARGAPWPSYYPPFNNP